MKDCSRKFTREFTWSITKDQAEKNMGPMSDMEFDHYCRVFENLFKNEYESITDILREDWEEFKDWVV